MRIEILLKPELVEKKKQLVKQFLESQLEKSIEIVLIDWEEGCVFVRFKKEEEDEYSITFIEPLDLMVYIQSLS